MAFIDMFNTFTILSIILFAGGIILIIVDMFEAGFGIFGAIGVILLIVNIFVTANSVAEGITLTLFTFAIITVLFIIFLVIISKGKLPKRMILDETEADYSGTKDNTHLLGKSGVVTTTCRPAGTAVIMGMKYDVVTLGEFIDVNANVEVVEVEGNRIVIKEKMEV